MYPSVQVAIRACSWRKEGSSLSRAERKAKLSRIRSQEYQHRKKVDMTVFWTALFLYIGVPLLWYGAIEFGWIRPIDNPDFKSAVWRAGSVIFLIILWYTSRVYHYFTDQEQIIEEDDEPPQANAA